MKKLITFLVVFLFVGTLSATTIYDVQYTTIPGGDNTYPSTYEGQEVTITGIVNTPEWTGYKDNFYISMPEGDAWKGILIYMAGDTTLVPGDEVEITGTVVEYYGMTEISGYGGVYFNVTLLSSGNPIPPATPVNCGELMITATAEPYEGVLVELNDVTVIQVPDSYGQWLVDDGTGLAQIDDGFFYLDEFDPPIVIELDQEWDIIRGCVDYSYDEYGVNPRTPDDLVLAIAVDENQDANAIILDNIPNPFSSQTEIKFYLRQSANVEIEIFNILGQKMKTISDDYFNVGEHSVEWNGKDENGNSLSDGVYFYKMNIENSNTIKRMILLR
ncbi:MAG: FlgD immunoglobulin-like domain containing protein [Candidatus Celaenobacter antarcticus]|nr:FlgD immunoglobulin-like domain containing protein [Candidatus Celaenobacter antarcticus]MDP8315539.1 FlgD immunoglobulin-like domain containing protein [Candidatus Celaenobacter antarcticus]